MSEARHDEPRKEPKWIQFKAHKYLRNKKGFVENSLDKEFGKSPKKKSPMSKYFP